MAYVIIGASGELGRALAIELAAAGHSLVLVGHGQARLDQAADALEQAGHPRPALVSADVTGGPGYLAEVRRAALALGGVEGLLLPIGRSTRDDLATPPGEAAKLIAINLRAPMEAVDALWEDLTAAPRPVIVGFGSITAIRGRGRNLAYGAAKRGLQSYFESLRVLGAAAGIACQFYVLGFLDTTRTAGEPTPLPKADVNVLAARVAADLNKGAILRWHPWWWRPLAWAIRLVPGGIYARLAAPRSG
jgi:short-subunit dehydrogenase